MQWITETLLKKEINKLSSKDNLDEQDHFLLTQCKKELSVLNRLRIEGIDTRGNVEEVEERLKGNSIYFINKAEYDNMYQKSVLFDAIKSIVNT